MTASWSCTIGTSVARNGRIRPPGARNSAKLGVICTHEVLRAIPRAKTQRSIHQTFTSTAELFNEP